MSEPTQGTFCQICHGPWPDGHLDWCPIKTQQPQPGYPGLQQQMMSGQGQSMQGSGLLGQMGTDPQRLRMAYIIEHLCDHLREMRREDSTKFYGSPYENLYRSLDAALDSYYQAKKP
jgi:hypothetical protein